MEYDIGDYVAVLSARKKGVVGNRVTYPSIPIAGGRLGRVVGKCRRSEGTREFAGGLDSYYGDYPERYLNISKTHEFYLVRFGWLNKPVMVSEESMRLAKTEEIKDLPKLFTLQQWTQQNKDDLSEDSKSWPRDSKGRWVKGNALNYKG